jgi:hypothetical protein
MLSSNAGSYAERHTATRCAADLLIPFDDVASGLRRTDTATREWIGLMAYWLTGRSAELFPGL